MSRGTLALGLIILGLVLPPLARAKEAITRLKICGASRCTTITDLRVLGAVMTDVGDSSMAPPDRAPFYAMRPEKTREWPSTWPHYVYVPSSDAVRVSTGYGDRYWDPLDLDLAAPMLKKATRDLKPNPIPEAWSAVEAAPSRAPGESNRAPPWSWFAGGGLALIAASLVAQHARRRRQAVSH
jgi:hypothetical protein